MADHTLNALGAAARAMEEVVLPAVDPGHPLAREQAGLVLKFLKLWADRLDYRHDRNRFELRHYLDLAEALRAGPRPSSAALDEALDEAITRGRGLIDEASAPLPDIQAASRTLAGVVAALVRTAAGMSDPSRAHIDALILHRTRELLNAQRAWFLPQGWEPDPAKVPAIAIALNPARPNW